MALASAHLIRGMPSTCTSAPAVSASVGFSRLAGLRRQIQTWPLGSHTPPSHSERAAPVPIFDRQAWGGPKGRDGRQSAATLECTLGFAGPEGSKSSRNSNWHRLLPIADHPCVKPHPRISELRSFSDSCYCPVSPLHPARFHLLPQGH